MQSSTGAPRKLNPEQELKLVDVITNNTPDEVGFDSRKNWTIELIRQWVINNFNILIKHSNVLLKYTSGKIVMILDNARIHHAKLIQPFLEENKDRLNFFFLPPYNPNLNLIEGLWG